MDILNAFKTVIAEDVGNAIKAARATNLTFDSAFDMMGLYPEHSRKNTSTQDQAKAIGSTLLNAASFVPAAAGIKIGSAGIKGAKAAVQATTAAVGHGRKAYTAARKAKAAIKNAKNSKAQYKSLVKANTGDRYVDDVARSYASHLKPGIAASKREAVNQAKVALRDGYQSAKSARQATRAAVKTTAQALKDSKKIIVKSTATGAGASGTEYATNDKKRELQDNAIALLKKKRY